ncbi:MAG TPA: VOC family protein [Gemmatimonadaceae bacterium]|jgi:catechol 2,3-dioxygenase-like lactoylglutathione lyase family enzyme
MDDSTKDLFNDFDRGTISRRRLLQALGLAAVTAPAVAWAQGRCGGDNASKPGCDTTPAKAPFDPTGWKTIALDHFTMQVADYKKEAGYYSALMNWKPRMDDGNKAVLDIGDFGNVVIRGGYVAPPTPPAPPRPAGDSAAGGGRGGRGGGGGAPRAPRMANWDSFCWGIDNWDKKKVEAALKSRGLNPVAGNELGVDYFEVKDPGGFTCKISDGKRTMRNVVKAQNISEPEPFDHTGWKTVWLDHLSFQCPDYKATVAFYEALLGWHGTGDEGSQNETEIGNIGNALIRGGGPPRPGAAAGERRMASLDHIAFGLSPWDTDGVLAELTKRGLTGRADTGGHGEIHEERAKYKSYHTTTPNGFDLQISNGNRATRQVR